MSRLIVGQKFRVNLRNELVEEKKISLCEFVKNIKIELYGEDFKSQLNFFCSRALNIRILYATMIIFKMSRTNHSSSSKNHSRLDKYSV